MHPNPRLQLPDETDADFTARICDADVLKEPRLDEAGNPLPDPALADLPFVDVDAITLPARTRRDAQGDEAPCRNAWRWNGAAVVVEGAAMPPNWPGLLPRLKQALPATKRAKLRDWLGAVKAAAEEQDAELVQALYDEIKTAQASATPPLTAQEFGDVQATLTAKRIPVVF